MNVMRCDPIFAALFNCYSTAHFALLLLHYIIVLYQKGVINP